MKGWLSRHLNKFHPIIEKETASMKEDRPEIRDEEAPQ